MKNFLLIVLLVCLFVAYVVEANARQALGEYIHVKLALTYLLSTICLEFLFLSTDISIPIYQIPIQESCNALFTVLSINLLNPVF